MALPNDSFTRTDDGSGTLIATHLVSGKEYQVVMEAGHQGHIRNTRDSYIAICPAGGGSAVAANKTHFDMFNASGSGKTMYVHGIWSSNDLDVAVAGVLGVRLDVFRTTAVGTGGTTLGFEDTTATNTISRIDLDSPTLPAQITARLAPTASSPTTGAFIGQGFFMPEEGATSMGYFTQWQNLLRYSQMEDVADLEVGPDSGFKILQGPVASVGRVGLRIVFSLV